MTPYRWVILGTHGLTILSSSFVGMTFSTVSGLISDIYNVPIAYINSCVSVFLVTQILMNFPSVSIIEKYGLSLSVCPPFSNSNYFLTIYFNFLKLRISAFLTMLGSVLRYVCLHHFKNFYLMLIPQATVALVAPILGNAVSKLAYRWFPEDEVGNFVF